MEVKMQLDGVLLEGTLTLPPGADTIVIFSHGSGSSRFSPRNKLVAEALQDRRTGTFLFDLLTREEDQDYSTRFNIPLLTERLAGATRWLENSEPAAGRRLGYFGASTGAASALNAAALLPQIRAVVSRGGRPDLAKAALPRVQAPTLLIVGGLDDEVIQLNQFAFNQLTCIRDMKIVPGASHLFEEAGTMDAVISHAGEWFRKYL